MIALQAQEFEFNPQNSHKKERKEGRKRGEGGREGGREEGRKPGMVSFACDQTLGNRDRCFPEGLLFSQTAKLT